MPIRGLADNPRMPRIGKIRLGIKVRTPEGKEYPRALDHFVCPDAVLDALRGKVPFCDGSCKAEPGPTMIPIMFVTDDLDNALADSFRAYKGSTGLVCKGDGYNADALLDADALDKRGGDISQPVPVALWAGGATKRTVRANVECWGEGYEGKPPCPLYEAKGCKKMMMPQFAILEAPGIGVYQLDTGSNIGIGNAYGFLRFMQTITGGRISGIPLQLHVVPQDVAPDGKKKTIHVIKLEAGFSMLELAERLKQPAMSALLPPPDESAEDLADFFPEAEPAPETPPEAPTEAEEPSTAPEASPAAPEPPQEAPAEDLALSAPDDETAEMREGLMRLANSYIVKFGSGRFVEIARAIAPKAVSAGRFDRRKLTTQQVRRLTEALR